MTKFFFSHTLPTFHTSEFYTQTTRKKSEILTADKCKTLRFKFSDSLKSGLLEAEGCDRFWLIRALMSPIKTWTLERSSCKMELKIAAFIRSYADEWRRRDSSVKCNLASEAAPSRSDSNIVLYDKFNQVALKQDIMLLIKNSKAKKIFIETFIWGSGARPRLGRGASLLEAH